MHPVNYLNILGDANLSYQSKNKNHKQFDSFWDERIINPFIKFALIITNFRHSFYRNVTLVGKILKFPIIKLLKLERIKIHHCIKFGKNLFKRLNCSYQWLALLVFKGLNAKFECLSVQLVFNLSN